MRQRHEHLPSTQRRPAHVVLHDRVAAPEPVLFPKPVEDPLRRMPLLDGSLPVVFQDGVDDAHPRPKLRTLFSVNYAFPWTTTISPYERQLPPSTADDIYVGLR